MKRLERLLYPYITAVLALNTDSLELLAADVGCNVVLDFSRESAYRQRNLRIKNI